MIVVDHLYSIYLSMKLLDIISEWDKKREYDDLSKLSDSLSDDKKKRANVIYKALKKGKMVLDTSFDHGMRRPEYNVGEVTFDYELPDLKLIWVGDYGSLEKSEIRIDIPDFNFTSDNKLFLKDGETKRRIWNKIKEKFEGFGINIVLKPKFFRFNSEGKPIGLVVKYDDWDTML